MKKEKYNHDRLNEVQAKYLTAVEKRAVRIGRSYIDKKFKATRKEAMKKHGHYMKTFGRKLWMQKTYKGTHEGGFLPFAYEEIRVTDAVATLDDLSDYIVMYGEDPDLLIPKWRQEAFDKVKEPKLLMNASFEKPGEPEEKPTVVENYKTREKAKKEERSRMLREIGLKMKY